MLLFIRVKVIKISGNKSAPETLSFASYELNQAGDTRIPLPRKSLWTPQKIVDCKVGLCTSLRTVAKFL